MPLIDATYFVGELAIAQRDQLSVQENINAFIEKYEPKILNTLLGVEFNALFQAGLLVDPIEEMWATLQANDTLKFIISNYVYYWYMRNNATQTAGIGEVIPSAENATVTSSINKTVRAWNEMVDMCREFTLDVEVYTTWVSTYVSAWDKNRGGYYYPEIYYKVNSLGI